VLGLQDLELALQVRAFGLELGDELAGRLLVLLVHVGHGAAQAADLARDLVQAELPGQDLLHEQTDLGVEGGLGLGIALLACGLGACGCAAALVAAGLGRGVGVLRTSLLRLAGATDVALVLTRPRVVLTVGPDLEAQDAREGLLERDRDHHALLDELAGAARTEAVGALSLDDGTHRLPVALAVGAVAELGGVGVHDADGATIIGLATEVDALTGQDSLRELEDGAEAIALRLRLGLGGLGFALRLGLGGLVVAALVGGLHAARDLERVGKGEGLELQVFDLVQALLAEAGSEAAVDDSTHLLRGTARAAPAGAPVHEHIADLLNPVFADLLTLDEGLDQALGLGHGLLGLLGTQGLGLDRLHHQSDGLVVVIRDGQDFLAVIELTGAPADLHGLTAAVADSGVVIESFGQVDQSQEQVRVGLRDDAGEQRRDTLEGAVDLRVRHVTQVLGDHGPA